MLDALPPMEIPDCDELVVQNQAIHMDSDRNANSMLIGANPAGQKEQSTLLPRFDVTEVLTRGGEIRLAELMQRPEMFFSFDIELGDMLLVHHSCPHAGHGASVPKQHRYMLFEEFAEKGIDQQEHDGDPDKQRFYWCVVYDANTDEKGRVTPEGKKAIIAAFKKAMERGEKPIAHESDMLAKLSLWWNKTEEEVEWCERLDDSLSERTSESKRVWCCMLRREHTGTNERVR